MPEIIKTIARGLPWYQYVVLAICAGLLITGFLLPPIGDINPSVLKGVGELMLGTWLFSFNANLPEYIKAGATIKLSHNGTEFEASGKKIAE